jgi:hypothetical protein
MSLLIKAEATITKSIEVTATLTATKLLHLTAKICFIGKICDRITPFRSNFTTI